MMPRKKFHGQVALAYIALYSAVRFGLEYFRGDAARGKFGPLWTSQWVAVVLVLGVIALVPYLLKRQRIAPPAGDTAAV